MKGDIPSLKKIRELCKNIIPVDDHYYFITNNNEIIKLEDNYNTLDVLQKDGEKKYKIDFKSVEFYENKPLLINVYLNGHKDSAIFVERKSDLSKVKQKLDSNISNNEKIFFATKGNFPIKNNNIKEFKIEDIIITEGNEKNINMYELNYYIKIKLIKDLKEMDKEIDNGNSIDWFQQAEFFVNVKELAGPEIANGIKEGLEKDLDGQAENDGNSPGNDECTNEKERKLRKDKEFIKKYLKLLLRDLDNSPPPSTA